MLQRLVADFAVGIEVGSNQLMSLVIAYSPHEVAVVAPQHSGAVGYGGDVLSELGGLQPVFLEFEPFLFKAEASEFVHQGCQIHFITSFITSCILTLG